MHDSNSHIEEIDNNRSRRARELAELKQLMASPEPLPRYGIHSKAVIVLSYAHWEGFYNECVRSYISWLKCCNTKVCNVSWTMLVGLLKPELQKLKDRNHSSAAELDFVDTLRGLILDSFDNFDTGVVLSRSNLNFSKLCQNFRVLNFDVTPFQKHHLQIDKQLVGWRHSIAHGNDPDLSSIDLKKHVEFTQDLLLTMADIFQEGLAQ